MVSLLRLRQSHSVAECTSQFKALSNRLCGVSEKNHLSCFLSGLKDDIRLLVLMLNPANFVAAKLQEEYIQSLKRPYCASNSSFSMGCQQTWIHFSTPPSQPLLPTSTQIALPAKPTVGFPMQRISASQMKEWHDKGLYYYCDEKWQPDHKCKSPKLYIFSGLELPHDDAIERYSLTPPILWSLYQNLTWWNSRNLKFPYMKSRALLVLSPCGFWVFSSPSVSVYS